MIENSQAIRTEQADEVRSQWTHALTEPEFQRELARDPRAAVEQRFGISLPEGIEVRFDERQPGSLQIVPTRGKAPGELSEGDLENVTGGIVTIEYLVLGYAGSPSRRTSSSRT
jgi:hypothetical protein